VSHAPAPAVVGRFAADLDALTTGEGLAVAVSGGADSLALLLLAQAARPGAVVAATVNHGLRPEAADEAAEVARICGDLGVEHAVLTVRVAAGGAGLQGEAREARYAALEAWARERGARALATAHHLDDQAETVLMRLARGAGVNGLQGVRPSRALGDGLMLVRPLLGWRKRELEAIIAAAGLTPADDPANADPRFDRTRARGLLAGGWPAPERVAATAARARDAEAALGWTTRWLAGERLREERDGVSIHVGDLPRELRRRLLLAGLGRLVPAHEARGDEIDRLLDRLSSGEVSTLAGVRVAPGPRWRLTLAPPRRSG
jgi:tRNA(Ile)-lysidine synthase